jgi:BirA family biotin operon repressor/biotin-[acetyl-CoA-carboxylase] ligase
MENGTHGRKWYTDEENNIAFSFFIKTNCNANKLEGITTEIAETMIFVFKELYNIELEIKIPNDIMCNNKKLGGILTQSKLSGNNAKYLVIGIGINTNQKIFDKDIEDIASSIKKEFNIEINRNRVISEFCNLFEEKILKRIGED